MSQAQVIAPVNGDPFVGFLETPVTSSPLVASYLSSLPAYRTGIAPLQRGVEVGLAHGFLLVGPFIKLGPLRNVEGVAEIAGSMSGAGLVLILALCLSIYGSAQFQSTPKIGVKTLSGRSVARDPLQSAQGCVAAPLPLLQCNASAAASCCCFHLPPPEYVPTCLRDNSPTNATYCFFAPCSWNDFTAGFTVGGLSGVAWGYICTQILPYYQ